MRGHDLFRSTALVALLVCYVAVLLGGEVMASDSGLGCPDWPTCHGTFFPSLVGPTGIEYSHRLGAFSLTLFVALLFVTALLFERRRPTLLRLAAGAFGLVAGQALLGGWVVRSGLSIGLVLAHFVLATVLLALLATIVLLVYLPVLPRRWVDWARRAGEEQPVRPKREPAPTRPIPGGSDPAPGD